MATKYFRGTATKVSQSGTIQITGYNVGTTYTLTVGNKTFSTIAQGSAILTATALVALWNASTHLHSTPITAASGGTDTITFTADVAGVPFVVAGSVAGGAGTIGAYVPVNASAGPNDWSTASNWSDGAIPANGDRVILQNCSVNICWGLAQSAVLLARLDIYKSYTGKIGLDLFVFATSADGETVSNEAIEYRERYLAIGATILNIGESTGSGNPGGSSRLMLNLGTDPSTTTIKDSAASSSEIGRPSIRLLCDDAATILYVEQAPGGVGIAVGEPNETSALDKVSISAEGSSTRVYVGEGVTIGTFEQKGGTNVLSAAATITAVNCKGGVLTINGDFTITTGNIFDGIVYDNHIKTAGNAWTTLNAKGGTIDTTKTNLARTWATVNMEPGSIIKSDGTLLTVTTFSDYAGEYSLSMI